MTQRMALLTKQTQAALQQLAAMQQSISTLVDTCTRAVIERLMMQGIIPFGPPAQFTPKHD